MNAIKKLINLGIDPAMPFAQKRALRVFNTFSVIAAPLPVLVAFMIHGGRLLVPLLCNCAMGLAFIAILILNHRRQYLMAKWCYYISSTITIVLHVYYLGAGLHLEITFVALFAGAFGFSHATSEAITFSVITILGYLGCIMMNYYVEPLIAYETTPAVHAAFSAIVFCMALGTLWMLKSQHDVHETIIQDTNKQLVAKHEQIELQNQRIVSTSRELELKNAAITAQHEELEQKNAAVAASISYAQRIQQAILPSIEEIRRHIGQSFIYYKPRDVVSGDFYWHVHFNSKTYFAIADCTGHGVPGGFMSMLGSSMLNLSVQSTFAESPRQILEYLDVHITDMLTRGSEESHEGMEIVVGIYDSDSRILKISSTNRPFFFISDGFMEQFKGTKAFIGKSLHEKKLFEDHVFNIKSGDCFYFFSDGITDQFDACNRKKYSIKRLRAFLTDMHMIDMKKQHALIENEMAAWMGDTPQTDDIILMGLRF